MVASRMVFFEILLAFLTGAGFSLLVLFAFCRHRRGCRLLLSTEGKATANLIETRISPATLHQKIPVSPKKFNGDPESFKEWVFTVELALRSTDISDGACQVDFVSTLLEGNALLWLIAAQDAGKSFGDWLSLKNAIAETFGPIQNEEENRLALFSLYQMNSLDEYIRDFTRLSLLVTGLDEHSRAVCFIRGLRDNLRAEAMREHPRTLSDAFVAARTAARLCSVVHYDVRRVTPNTREQKKISNNIQSSMRSPPRRKLQDEERKKLMREGKCFRCRQFGHLSRECPEHNQYPNADRQ